ncbi:MAG: aminotransferase, partial [Specibacter sp.]
MSHPWQRTAQGANLMGPDGSLGVTIFEEITTLANQHNAINLGQGFPDEDGPAELSRLAREAIAQGNNQYAPGKGILELR